MSIWSWLLLLSIVVMGQSCKSNTQPNFPREASLIDGNWLRSCQQNQGYYQIVELGFSYGERFERLETWFFDNACEQKAYQLAYWGRYEFTTSWEAYRYILDIWIEDSEMKSLSLPWREQANAAAYCGKSDWEIPLRAPLAGLQDQACPLLFQEENYQKNFIELIDDRLYFAEPFRPGEYEESEIDLSRKELQFVRGPV